MTPHIRGLVAAVHAPLHPDGTVNLACIEHQAEHLVSQRVIGSFVNGTTGESLSLTVSERMKIAERWMDVAKHSLRVIVHVGHNCREDARELAAHAQRIGAHGIAAMAPNFLKPSTVDDLVEFYVPIAAAAPDTPFYYYKLTMNGVDFPVTSFLDRAVDRIPSLAGVKFTHGDLADYGNCLMLHDHRWDILFGREQMLLSALALGALGAIGSSFSYTAPYFLELLGAWENGELALARRSMHQTRQALALIHCDNVLARSKAVMKMIGVDCGPPRSPLRSVSDVEYQSLERSLEEFGLFEDLKQAAMQRSARE